MPDRSSSRRSHWRIPRLNNLKTPLGAAHPTNAEKGINTMNNQFQKWAELLNQAINQPGLLLKAYSLFHNYSIGNQIAALVQCQMRGLEPGPINTYKGWQSLNRQVRKGERAIWLCMPLVRKTKGSDDDEYITGFIWKLYWFLICQTDGEQVSIPETPTWSKAVALEKLNITEVPFSSTDGNTQGYARKREIAVSPIAALPIKTLMHEIAHVLLGHTEAGLFDSEATPRNLCEVEAEAVAMILLESLNLPGGEYCRGYIRAWLKSDTIPERSCAKIFGCADRILKAGREE